MSRSNQRGIVDVIFMLIAIGAVAVAVEISKRVEQERIRAEMLQEQGAPNE